jgi:hypothetical protein
LQAQEATADSGFPATGFADETECLTRSDRKRNAVHCLHKIVAFLDRKILDKSTHVEQRGTL